MFETGYFDTQPFGPDNTAQMERMTSGSQFGIQSGDWYAPTNYGAENPWLVSGANVAASSPKFERQQINDNGITSEGGWGYYSPDQETGQNVWTATPWYDPNNPYGMQTHGGGDSSTTTTLGSYAKVGGGEQNASTAVTAPGTEAYTLDNGNTIATSELYGYGRYGIGQNNRNILGQMVGFDGKVPEGAKTPDQIAADQWMQHFNQYGSGYTDSSGSVGRVKDIGNTYLNQNQIKQQVGATGPADITQSPMWAQWAPWAQDLDNRAMVDTQARNNSATGASSRDLAQFVLTAATLYAGGAAGAGAGGSAGAAAAPTAAGAANLASQAASMYGQMGGQGAGWAGILAKLGKLYASSGTSAASDTASEGGSAMADYDWGDVAADDAFNAGSSGWDTTGYDFGGDAAQWNAGDYSQAMGDVYNNGAGGGAGFDLSSMLPYLGAVNQGYQTYQRSRQPTPQQGGGGNSQGGYQIPWGGILSGAMGIYGANQNNKNLQQLLQQATQGADPFASQRGFYQNQLQQSYADPQAMWNSPQWQALRSQMLEESTARDAAGGRLSDFGNRDRLIAREFMGNYLPKIQQNLQGPAGANANPSIPGQITAQLAGQLNQSNVNQQGAYGNLLNEILKGGQPNPTPQNQQPGSNQDFLQMLMRYLQQQGQGSTDFGGSGQTYDMGPPVFDQNAPV